MMYWLHMLATIIWIGSLAALNLLVLPASHRTLKLADQLSFIAALQKRLEPLIWFCVGILIVTGLIQLSTNPHYDGFLALSTQWSIAMLVKHILFMGIIIVSAIQTWEILPAIQRTLLKKDKAPEGELATLHKKEMLVLRLSLMLAVLILGATAIARIS